MSGRSDLPSKRSARAGSVRSRRGQSLVEVLVGGVILVPIVLAIIDLATVVLGGEICNDLCKQAARAAGNAAGRPEALAAVADIQSHFNSSSTYSGLSLVLSTYDNTPDGLATVQGGVTITLPVPVPFLQIGPNMGVKSQATEAIVGIPPPRPLN